MSEKPPGERMLIQYDSTFQEAVEAHLRALNRLNLIRKDVWKGTLALAVLVAAFILLTIPHLPRRDPISVSETLGWVGFGIVLAVLVFPRLHRRSVEQRIRKVLRELRGDENPMPFQVELMESGVSTTLQGVQTTYDWASIVKVEDTPDAIDFVMGNGGFVATSKRAFTSPEAARQFIQLAGDYMIRAQTSQNGE